MPASEKYGPDVERQDVGHRVQQIQNGSSTCGVGQGGDPELTTTIRKSAIINEHVSGKAIPNGTLLTATDLENFFVERIKEGKHEDRSSRSSGL